ncbi:MAG: hypothetical protein IPM66_14610 [Acidobacteriota bacterium]|nr:MAG: hypothetical protein IPM66_14610 [Acidobacteriota bacterium]
MTSFVQKYYSPRQLRQVVTRLRIIEALLQRLYREREYDEWSKGSLDKPTLIDLQEKLKDQYDHIVENHLCLLVSLFSISDVKLWTEWVLKATKDFRTINTDNMPKHGEELKRSISRIEPWVNRINIAQNWKMFILNNIKMHWKSYVIALLFSIFVNILSNYVYDKIF